MPTDLAAMVLAAGLGTRLRPLTLLRPKPLCPVGGRSILDLALDAVQRVVGSGPDQVAVNSFHLADQVRAAVAGRATVSVETDLLGTAGGVGRLRTWRDGRPLLLLNGDSWLRDPDSPGNRLADLSRLLDGDGIPWDGHTVRMLGVPTAEPDFVDGKRWRYVGACLLPADLLEPLHGAPAGLNATVWQPAHTEGRLEFVAHHGVAIDTGTPPGYLAANLDASGGRSVIGRGAVVLGRVEESVVWDGAHVGPGERLCRVIRAGTRQHPVTVHVDGLSAGRSSS